MLPNPVLDFINGRIRVGYDKNTGTVSEGEVTFKDQELGQESGCLTAPRHRLQVNRA